MRGSPVVTAGSGTFLDQVRTISSGSQPDRFREARAVRARKRIATFVYPAL